VKFLVDTNILIALEPASPELEENAPLAAEFVSLAISAGHQIVRHRAQGADQQRDRVIARRQAREVLLAKYPLLPRVRPMPASLAAALGTPEQGSNDWVDNELIAAVEALAVDFLVTQDAGIHRKARRAGLEDRVLFVAGARDLLLTLVDRPPAAPPSVEWVTATELDERDAIFSSLRSDYPGFDKWLGECRRQERHVALIRDAAGSYAAVAIVARKADKFGTTGSWLKISTFKVADEQRGRRYGELLLKALFEYRRALGFDYAYVTVFDRHDALVRLFGDFGFAPHVDRTSLGEAILLKSFKPSEADRNGLPALEYHVRFGPPALALDPEQTFVVPIEPRYHRLLFPDAERQMGLPGLAANRPFGNGLRKAYLCHSATRLVAPGATLLFYRSHDTKGLTSAGVVESASHEPDAEAITRLVGTRTVYSSEEIGRLATKPVLVILFRQDRILEQPIPLAELVARQLLSGHPQTVTRARREGAAWLKQQIGA
jgi:L-amino acid N-acyltransferase YncA